MVVSILKIGITRNTIYDNLVGLPKSGHNFVFARLSIPVSCHLVQHSVSMCYNEDPGMLQLL